MSLSGTSKDIELTILQPPLAFKAIGFDAAESPIQLHIYPSSADKSELFRLRYSAYRAAGWIDEKPHDTFSDRYDELSSTYSIGAFHNGRCVGALRLAFGGCGSLGLMPCEEQFPNEVAALTAGGRRLVEFSRLAVDPSIINYSFRTRLYGSLARAGFILAYAAAADVGLVAVHRKFSLFYQAMCGFKVVAKAEGYGDIAMPTHFLCRDLAELERRAHQHNAFFTFAPEEIEHARDTLQRHVPDEIDHLVREPERLNVR